MEGVRPHERQVLSTCAQTREREPRPALRCAERTAACNCVMCAIGNADVDREPCLQPSSAQLLLHPLCG